LVIALLKIAGLVAATRHENAAVADRTVKLNVRTVFSWGFVSLDGSLLPPPALRLRAQRVTQPVRSGDVVPGERIELPTNGLQNRCSTAELTRHLTWRM
jgi:hypothetical protein